MKLVLSPIDHFFTGQGAYPVQFVFRFECPLPIESMHAALTKTLKEYWPVAARLKAHDTKSYYFEPSNDVALLSEQSIADVDWTQEEDIQKLVNDVETVPGERLAKFKYSKTPNGFYLGASISHAVVDGFSYFMFMNAWAQNARGEIAEVTPQHERHKLIPHEMQPFTGNSVDPMEFGFFWESRRQAIKDTPRKFKLLHYSQADLDQMRDEESKNRNAAFTDNDVLTADLAKKLLRGKDKPVYLSIAFDYRRLYKIISRSYFGNAVRPAIASFSAEEIDRLSIGEIASRVRSAVRSLRSDDVQKSLQLTHNIRETHGLSAMEKFHVAHPDCGLTVTNLSKLPLNTLDFGSGAPVGIRCGVPAPNVAIVLPSSDGVDVLYCEKT